MASRHGPHKKPEKTTSAPAPYPTTIITMVVCVVGLVHQAYTAVTNGTALPPTQRRQMLRLTRHGSKGGLVVLEVVYSPRGLAAAPRLQLPHRPRRTTVDVYSKFITRKKTEVDHFVTSMSPYDIIVGDFSDDTWAASPTGLWEEGLEDASLPDPLLATPHTCM